MTNKLFISIAATVLGAVALQSPVVAQRAAEPDRIAPRDAERAARAERETAQQIEIDQRDRAQREQELDLANRQMEQARRELEAAAREVARLSGGRARPVFRDFTLAFPPPRAMLGLTLDDNDAPNGARVLGVSPGGAAAEAGVVVGDVITAIDGVELPEGGSARGRLVEYMTRVEPGKAVVLDISRDGEAREITVEARGTNFTLATNEFRVLPATPGVPGSGTVQLGDNGYAVWSGTGSNVFRFDRFLGPRWNDIELVPLSEELGRYFGTSEGLLVVRAPKDDAIGLMDGDVILDIGGRVPTTPEHAMRILMSFEPGETLRFAIMRRERRQTLEYAIPEDNRTD